MMDYDFKKVPEDMLKAMIHADSKESHWGAKAGAIRSEIVRKCSPITPGMNVFIEKPSGRRIRAMCISVKYGNFYNSEHGFCYKFRMLNKSWRFGPIHRDANYFPKEDKIIIANPDR